MKKSCAPKVLLAIWEIFLHENNRNPTGLVTNSLLFSYCSFLHTKNKNQVFSKLVVWYREIFLPFVYSESHSTSKPCQLQKTFMKEFCYMLSLFVLKFLDFRKRKKHFARSIFTLPIEVSGSMYFGNNI